MTVLIAPTEVDLLKELGELAIVSSEPEKHGADVLIYTNQGILGIQRKKMPGDFISSINDGRIAREAPLLKQTCKFQLFLCEEPLKCYPDGTIMMAANFPGMKFYTKARVRGAIFDIRYIMGIDVDVTDNVQDTAKYIKEIIGFFEDKKHYGLYVRPSAPSEWIRPTAKDIDLWLLQSFDGIGPTIADNIIEFFHGVIPIAWTCTLDDLKRVPKLSNKKAEQIYNMLPHVIDKEIATNETYQEKLARLLKNTG